MSRAWHQMPTKTQAKEEKIATTKYNTRGRNKRAPSSPNKKKKGKKTKVSERKAATQTEEEVEQKSKYYCVAPHFKVAQTCVVVKSKQMADLFAEEFGDGTVITGYSTMKEANACKAQTEEVLAVLGAKLKAAKKAQVAEAMDEEPPKSPPYSPGSPAYSVGTVYSLGSVPDADSKPPAKLALDMDKEEQKSVQLLPARKLHRGMPPRPSDPVVMQLALSEEELEKLPPSSFKTPSPAAKHDDVSDDSVYDVPPPLFKRHPDDSDDEEEEEEETEDEEEEEPKKRVKQVARKTVLNPYKKPAPEKAKPASTKAKAAAKEAAADSDEADEAAEASMGISVNRSALTKNVSDKSSSSSTTFQVNYWTPVQSVRVGDRSIVVVSANLCQKTKMGPKIHWLSKADVFVDVLSDDAISFIDPKTQYFMTNCSYAVQRKHEHGANKPKLTTGSSHYEIRFFYGFLLVDSLNPAHVSKKVGKLGKTLKSIIPANWFREAYTESLKRYEGVYKRLTESGQLWEDAKSSPVVVTQQQSLDSHFMDDTIQLITDRVFGVEPAEWTEEQKHYAFHSRHVPASFYTTEQT